MKEKEIEDLQQEVADLKALNEKLRSEKEELEDSKKYWVDRSYEYEGKYNRLVEQVKSVGVIVSAMAAA